MNLTTGSIVSLTPAAPGTRIEFFPRPSPHPISDPWGDFNITCPVIGWAVVVSSTKDHRATTTLVPAYLHDDAVHILSTVPDPELGHRILLPQADSEATST